MGVGWMWRPVKSDNCAEVEFSPSNETLVHFLQRWDVSGCTVSPYSRRRGKGAMQLWFEVMSAQNAGGKKNK